MKKETLFMAGMVLVYKTCCTLAIANIGQPFIWIVFQLAKKITNDFDGALKTLNPENKCWLVYVTSTEFMNVEKDLSSYIFFEFICIKS